VIRVILSRAGGASLVACFGWGHIGHAGQLRWWAALPVRWAVDEGFALPTRSVRQALAQIPAHPERNHLTRNPMTRWRTRRYRPRAAHRRSASDASRRASTQQRRAGAFGSDPPPNRFLDLGDHDDRQCHGGADDPLRDVEHGGLEDRVE